MSYPSCSGSSEYLPLWLLFLLITVTGFVGTPLALAQTPETRSEDTRSGNDKVLSVTVRSFEQLAYHPLKKAPAYVVTLQNSLLSSQITTLVDKVPVKVGDQVKQGQLLVALDCDDYIWEEQQLKSEKEALRANFKFTQYQYQRSKKLLKTKSVSEESHYHTGAELKNLQAKIQSLDVRIKKARKNIRRCEIKAPFAGVVSERVVNVGEYVAPGSPLLRLINTDELEVEVQIPVTMVNQLEYQSLEFVYRDEHFPLKLRAVIPSIETRARHQRVRLEFIDKKAMPDAFGMVHVLLKSINIPANVLVQRGGRTGVFIVTPDAHPASARLDNEPARKKQTSGMATFYPIDSALSGRPATVDLPPHTLIVLQGRHALSDGQKVVIQKDNKSSW